MSARLRLLYSSNAFWCNSGYGVQGKSLLPRLAELPTFGGMVSSPVGRQNIAQFAWYGLQGGMHNVEGFMIYPMGVDPYGNDIIGQHTKHFGANIVVSLIDVWVMHETARKVAPALWCPYLPIDHDPVPQRFLDSLAGAHLPITYAKWGHNMLTRAGVENVYVPHGVEPDIYKVEPRDAALEFKRRITGIDNAHLSVMVAANKGMPDRKWFQGQVETFAAFAEDKPEARLYIHSEPTPMYGGIDFGWLIPHLGLQGKVLFPDRYMNFLGIPPTDLALVYNAADVLLGCSMSEGFGIPIIEAQACGTPVVVTNFSAMPELVRWGEIVDVADMWLTPMNAYQAWPSKTDMLAKLNKLYDEWLDAGGDWPMEKRQAASKQIHDEYGWDSIVRDHWAPLMTRLAEEAPPLDSRFQMTVAGFVDTVQQEIAKDKPKRRVAPLKPRYDAASDEEAQAPHYNNGLQRLPVQKVEMP